MKNSFSRSVKKATPKSCIKLVNSPFASEYLRIDSYFINQPDLRLESVKAFSRAYQKQKKNLSFTIKEVETFISSAKNAGLSTDEFFDSIFKRSQQDEKVAKLMLFIFLYLRGEQHISTTS
jgi:hypothetical protein